MKRFLTISLSLCLAMTAVSAQRVSVGARAPRIADVEWLSDRPELKGRAMMVEFFHSSNKACRRRVDECHRIASRFADSLNVVIVAREPEEQIAPLLFREYQYYYIAVDDKGTVFRSFGVPYVPYAVLTDSQGVVCWTGNPETLDSDVIGAIIK